MWIDTHAHLNDEHFSDRVEETIDAAEQAGVRRIVVIGIDAASSETAVALAERHPALFAVVGIQPNSLGRLETGDWERIVELADASKVVGIGESGLDRFWDFAPIELQNEYFLRHLRLAREREMPIVIHCRDAERDVVETLTRFQNEIGAPISGVMHSFCGEVETARRCLELGLHISFAGMVTFKKNDALREVAAQIPRERLLVETDSPYLSPHPLRGRKNQPAHVIHTGACLADVHQVPVEEMAAITSRNAEDLFRLTDAQTRGRYDRDR